MTRFVCLFVQCLAVGWLAFGEPKEGFALESINSTDSFLISSTEDSTQALHTKASLKAAMLYEPLLYEALPHDPMQYESLHHTSQSIALTAPVVGKKRSIGGAFAMSAVIPGLGQAYNRQWGKAIAAVVLEAAVITSSAVWRNQGNGLETDYQQFAHSFWDPGKYAAWLNDYSVFTNVAVSPVEVPAGIDFQNPDAWSAQEWDQVLSMFDQIQAIEREMSHIETGAAFSHTLPDFSEQQYYELIGKYYQFAPGWDDYPEWLDANGNPTSAIDPNMTGADGESKPNVSSNFFRYADDHAHANDVLRRASRISGLLILTHLVSAVDAAVSAKLHNDRITPGLEITTNQGSVRPVATLTYKFR